MSFCHRGRGESYMRAQCLALTFRQLDQHQFLDSAIRFCNCTEVVDAKEVVWKHK